ncbi:MAG: DUF1853 family protein [Herminiimonas sp.]|nr:DUF1853 family protein [Herminiimonas sp.]
MPVPESCQSRFHRRWDHLHDVHVRALAWLLDAPDLLDADAPRWSGKIAGLDIDRAEVAAWLGSLEKSPAALHAFLNMSSVTRLGRYAEKLMAFYFGWCGTLVAHGLQVRAENKETIGEFDFLLREGGALLHLEFATKFYLFEAGGEAPENDPAHYFVGPNLADTLDAKMDKILNRQLALARHPAALACLPQPVLRSQALVKGWLFYRQDHELHSVAPGVAAAHCRGGWCSLAEFANLAAEGFLLLPRLAWLAPARVAADDPVDLVRDHAAMTAWLQAHFAGDAMPVMVAMMEVDSGVAREVARCFVVPDDWRERAHERAQRTVLRLGSGQ